MNRLTILALLLIPTTATAQEVLSVTTSNIPRLIGPPPELIQYGSATLIAGNVNLEVAPAGQLTIVAPETAKVSVRFEDDTDDRNKVEPTEVTTEVVDGIKTVRHQFEELGRVFYYSVVVDFDNRTVDQQSGHIDVGELVPVDPPVDPPTNTLSDISRRGAVAAEDPNTAKLSVTKIEEALKQTALTNDPQLVRDRCEQAASNAQRRLGRPVASDWTQWNKTVGVKIDDMSPLMADEMRKAWRDVVRGLKDSTEAVVTVSFEVEVAK